MTVSTHPHTAQRAIALGLASLSLATVAAAPAATAASLDASLHDDISSSVQVLSELPESFDAISLSDGGTARITLSASSMSAAHATESSRASSTQQTCDQRVVPHPSDASSYAYKGIARKHYVLTFDDGPSSSARNTARVLDLLKAHHIEGAVFFVTGRNVARHPELVRRIVSEGHFLGSHTYSHANLSKLSAEQIRSELQRTDAAIDKALGCDYQITMVRPPFGATNDTVRKVIHEEGASQILWQVDSQDWMVQTDINHGRAVDRNVEQRIVDGLKVIDKLDRGGFILMHDSNRNTVNELDSVLTTLDAKGYTSISAADAG